MGDKLRVVRGALVVLVSLAAVLLLAVPAGAATPKARLLTLHDLPSGWSQIPSKEGSGAASTQLGSCFASLGKSSTHEKKASAVFSGDGGLLEELLATGRGDVERLHAMNRSLRRCHGATVSLGGKTLHLAFGRLSIPKVARTSVAFSLRATMTTVKVAFDGATFRSGRFVGTLVFGGPSSSGGDRTFVAFLKEAVAKIEGKHVTPPSISANV